MKDNRDYNYFEIYEKKRGSSFNPKSITFIGLILLVIFVLGSFGLFGWNIYVAYNISTLTERTEELKTNSKFKEAESVQNALDVMKEYDNNAEIALNKFRDANTLGTVTLTKISSAIPAGAVLDSLSTDHIQTTFSFTVADRKTAAELLVNLKELDIFYDVHMVSITLSDGGAGYTTGIEGTMKAGEKSE